MNRQQWYFEDPTYALCLTPATLKHIMIGCKTSLMQGRYTWRHSQILKILESALESKRSMTNSQPPRASNFPKATLFVREWQKTPQNPSTKSGQPCLACDWKRLADIGDIGQPLIFLPESALTNLRPDLILWLPSLKMVYIIELRVPLENSRQQAYEGRKLCYVALVAETKLLGWNIKVYPLWIDKCLSILLLM